MSDSPSSLIEADPRAFGRLISQIRKAKGLTQEQVVGRVSDHYGEVRSYRRIEAGTRSPARDTAIAILSDGLDVDSQDRISQALSLLSYAPLTREEAVALKLTGSDDAKVSLAEQAVPTSSQARDRKLQASQTVTTAIIAISVAIGGITAICLTVDALAVAGTAIIYAALYAVSVQLENHVQGDRDGSLIASALAFGVTLITSVAVLAADAGLVRHGSEAGLGVALVLLWAAAAGQWFIVRPALPDRAVAPLRYQALTAQAAHLKNTLYFVLLASVFWIPPMHAITVLERELHFGHVALVQQLASHQVFIIGRGIIAPGPAGLLGAFVVMLAASPIMAYPLFTNLKQDRRQNGYCILLFTRTALIFGLSILCLGWYAMRLASLNA